MGATRPAVAARYERKFICTPMTLDQVLMIIRTCRGHFREIFHRRTVNNIYLDTVNADLFQANLDGSTHRLKARIRWYGELTGHIARPVLEFKLKQGLMGTKDSFRLPGFDMPVRPEDRAIEALFRGAELPGDVRWDLASCRPSLINRYHRRYFLSADRRCRITVDWNLDYRRWSRTGTIGDFGVFPDGRLILEVKYGVEVADDVDALTQEFPFRLSRFSKYVMGMEATSPILA